MNKLVLHKTKRPFAFFLALLMVFALLPTAALAADYDGHWSQEYIDAAISRGWMSGYTDGTFKPDNSITRAEFSAMLWRALGETAPNGSSPFSDVAANAWYHDAVLALYEASIVSGVGNNTFAPDSTLTREMGFTMLSRAFDFETNDAGAYSRFSDSSEISTWARDAVSALAERGYVAGIGNNQCAPQKPLTRGETAKLLVAIFDGESAPDPVEPGKPTDDKTGPTISLSQSPTSSTSGSVTITVTASDASGVAYIGRRTSSSGATYTTSSGFTDITSASKFTVSSNGWYAVCATDVHGNFNYKLIQITNITGSSGGGGGGGGGTTSVAVTGVSVSGTAAVGETLTANVTPSNATNLSYQWYVSDTDDNTGGTVISGATSKTYVVGAAMEGNYVYVIVNGYNSSKATSAQTTAIAPAPVAVAFSSALADGAAGSATTTKVTLTFDKDITGLAASDITITAGSTGSTKGALTRTGTGVYELTLTGVTASGSITVAVAKAGFAITPASKTVSVVFYQPPVAAAFSSAVADGNAASASTTKVTLTFDKDIAGLATSDITITANGTGATRGTLTKVAGTGVYELTLTGITSSGSIGVAVAKAGYTFTPSSITTVAVVFYEIPVTFNSAVADGTDGSATTTKVTLTFDKDITELAASDITITAGSTGATAGALTRTGSGVYELTLTGITQSGNITIGVAKSGYAITPNSIANVAVVYYQAPVVTVTRTSALGVYKYTVLIDGSAPGESYDLYIFNAPTNTWIKAANGTSAPVEALTEYTNGSNCILVLASATNRATISSNTNAMIGAEKNNSGYAPTGAGVYLTTITGS